MSTVEAEIATAVGPDMAGTLMDPEEFDAIEEWEPGFVYELIHGVLIVSPPPLEAERDPNGELEYLLRYYGEHHPQGAALDVTLSEHHVRGTANRRRADRAIWAGLGRLPDPAVDLPTIVVEFVSRGKRSRKRDYEEKRQEYLELGIVEYWLFDRFRRIMTVFPSGDRPTIVVPADGIYRTPLLPGFELPVASILAKADRWSNRDQG